MKKFFNLMLLAGLATGTMLTSCNDDDPAPSTPDTEETVTGNITGNTTWTADKEWILGGRITVENGATLTIQPGTVIKGEAGSGANATSLLVARGGKLNALGTPTLPIIFTTIADEITPADVAAGRVSSPNLDPTLNGLWGGVIILGNAPIQADGQSLQIEGIPPSDPNGLYGGTNFEDNSGTITYISIRHGGANIGEGNEINGLTLGGVGRGTTINGVEIVSNQDDGVEWFGGSVNVTNVVVWNTGDDAIDTDQGWEGTVDNVIIIAPGDECFELDGSEGGVAKTHVIKNASAQATTFEGTDVIRQASGLADLDSGSDDPIADTQVDMENIYFFNIVDDQDVDDYPAPSNFSNFQATIVSANSVLEDHFKKGSADVTTEVLFKQNTVGANKSAFAGWSWAEEAGALADFK